LRLLFRAYLLNLSNCDLILYLGPGPCLPFYERAGLTLLLLINSYYRLPLFKLLNAVLILYSLGAGMRFFAGFLGKPIEYFSDLFL
jgi:hypothetical protein